MSRSFSLVSTSNVMLLSFRMTNGNKSFRGHFEAIAEESMTGLPSKCTGHWLPVLFDHTIYFIFTPVRFI